MLHPDIAVVDIGGPLGHGLVARNRIPKGTITWSLGPKDIVLAPGSPELDDPVLAAELPRHAYVDRKGRYVFCRDEARFMNHSCAPTTTSIGSLCDIALRDIEAGEAITCDYALLNLPYEFACACGAATCRGVVTQRQFATRAPQIDSLVGALVKDVATVPQALRADMLKDDAERLARILSGTEAVPSIMENIQGATDLNAR